MLRNLQATFLLLFLCTSGLWAQTGSVQGNVTDGEFPLIGVTVVIPGSTTGTVTDFDGNYRMDLDPGTYDLVASYVGYDPLRQQVVVTAGKTSTLNFTLISGLDLDEVVVTGTRASNRTNIDSPVPVDVISVAKMVTAAPQTSLNQLLNQTAPSFTSNTQTISDGTDHIDPASLRGLGPDQVLVLINGKRRHNTSLVNVNGTFGRGNVGTDLNAIPASAIERIEVLRDGAAAQYGSDAIAGVINIKLKENPGQFDINVTTGANFTSNIGPFGGETRSIDGENIVVGANYGIALGDRGGYLNLTGELDSRGSTNRMLEFTGGIYNGLNAVERVASAAVPGIDVTTLSLSQIQEYAQDVSFFSAETLSDLNGLTSIDGIGDVLGGDYTDDELAARGQQASDFNMRVGQSELRGGKLFANMALPIGESSEFYAFGGTSYRRGSSGCFYRLPSQSRTTTSIYPNGTVPKINSNITDNSMGAGVRGMVGNWNSDFSIVTGKNTFLFNITDAHNATLGSSSPNSFDSGGHDFAQTTSNIDFSRYYDIMGGLKGANVAFGGEYRYENFGVIPGTELSWGNYDINGNLVNSATSDDLLTVDLLGRARPSGCQCFAGFLPSNEVDANRSSIAGYVDTELDVSDALLLGAAIRYENFSDFGSTFNYKATARFKITKNIAIRGAFSTGFRAPSLHQIHFSRTSTIFTLVDGISVPQEVGVFSNTSRAAKLLGIPELKQETSQNFSVGATFKIPRANLRITADVYQVAIDDRVVLTGQFGPGSDEELQRIFQQSGATKAAFFANAINTTSQGLDVVIGHSAALGGGVLRSDLAGTFSGTTWNRDEGINASALLEEKGLVGTYFNQESQLYLERASVRQKVSLGNTLELGKLSIYLRNTWFGSTLEATSADIFDEDFNVVSDQEIAQRWVDVDPDGRNIDDGLAYAETVNDPINTPKLITDISFGYQLTEFISLTVGANNLLDVYPDEVDAGYTSSGRFVYSRRSPQFSFSGRHLFARLSLNLK